MTHPVLCPGNVAVITGGASGIGRAAALHCAGLGMRVALADLGADRLAAAAQAIRGAGAGDVLAAEADVGCLDDLKRLHTMVLDRFGQVDLLMNNAGIQPGSDLFGPQAAWDRVMAVNLWGVIHGAQVFVPGMIEAGRPGLVINTGSKQGITTPPGDPAYNVSKAGVKAYTEALAHGLRGLAPGRITAHLLIPGFVFTALTAQGRTERPAAAWTPEQTVAFLFDRVAAGDFYILCPDNEVPRALDERRILWAAGDIVENRPALSRWHPDYAQAFAEFSRKT
jgi:NAD(P)-dependent dehydrogenase (short-subunit alcohol dehydrogenase family)